MGLCRPSRSIPPRTGSLQQVAQVGNQLSISRIGYSATSLSSLFQGSPTFTAKTFFLIFVLQLFPLPLVLSLYTTEKILAHPWWRLFLPKRVTTSENKTLPFYDKKKKSWSARWSVTLKFFTEFIRIFLEIDWGVSSKIPFPREDQLLKATYSFKIHTWYSSKEEIDIKQVKRTLSIF